MLAKFSVKKPYTVLVGVILVIVLGVVSLMKMSAAINSRAAERAVSVMLEPPRMVAMDSMRSSVLSSRRLVTALSFWFCL